MTAPGEPDGMNLTEAAAYLGWARNTLKKHLARVPHRRLDARTVLFSRRQLSAWMAGPTGEPTAAPAPAGGGSTAGRTGANEPPAGRPTGARNGADRRRPFQRVPGKIAGFARSGVTAPDPR